MCSLIKQSNNIAVIDSNKKYSYIELYNIIKHKKESLFANISVNDIVSIKEEKSINYIANIIALIELQAIFVPISTEIPKNREQLIINEIMPKYSLINNELHKNSTYKTIKNFNFIKKENFKPCYIFFTSGSTGIPKGVLGDFNSLMYFINFQIKKFNISKEDIFSFFTNIGFDVSLRDILTPLMAGAKVCIFKQNINFTPTNCLQFLQENKITVVHAVPSLIKSWLNDLNKYNLSVNQLFLAGEKLELSLINSLQNILKETKITNLYGPTETTLAKFFYTIDGNINNLKEIPVGKPIDKTSSVIFIRKGINNTSWFKNINNRLTAGEIIIKTKTSSLGYINTNNNNFYHEDGYIYYKTGDLGYIKDNNLIIQSRYDDEVKINGVRINVKEINSIVINSKLVNDSTIITIKDNNNNLKLAIFYIANSNSNESVIKDYLLSYFPKFIVPTIWIKLDELPLNANKKIDKLALSKIYEQKNNIEVDNRNLNSKELWVVTTIKDILNLKHDVSLNHNIFNLGATSLDIAEFIAQMDHKFTIELEFNFIFKNPIIGDIVKYIANHKPSTSKQVEINKIDLDYSQKYLISPNQRRWYNIYMPEKNRSWATMVRRININKPFNKKELEQAFSLIIKEQLSLQTYFVNNNNTVYQKFKNDIKVDIIEHNLLNEYKNNLNNRINEIQLVIANNEIGIYDAPLFRINALITSNNEYTIIFTIHHLISDGISQNILESQLQDILINNKTPNENRNNYLEYTYYEIENEKNNQANKNYWLNTIFKEKYNTVELKEQWQGKNSDEGKFYNFTIP